MIKWQYKYFLVYSQIRHIIKSERFLLAKNQKSANWHNCLIVCLLHASLFEREVIWSKKEETKNRLNGAYWNPFWLASKMNNHIYFYSSVFPISDSEIYMFSRPFYCNINSSKIRYLCYKYSVCSRRQREITVRQFPLLRIHQLYTAAQQKKCQKSTAARQGPWFHGSAALSFAFVLEIDGIWNCEHHSACWETLNKLPFHCN